MESNFALHVSFNFLIFVASKLLNGKTEESRSNQILNYIYVIVIVFKCIRTYAQGYTLKVETLCWRAWSCGKWRIP